MKNLIQNARWRPGPDGGPACFTNTGPITYDAFSLRGFRTCSVTMSNDNSVLARCAYDRPVEIHGQSALSFSVMVRAVELQHMALVADFFDPDGRWLRGVRHSLTSRVTSEFGRRTTRFSIPCGAHTVRLAAEFTGRVTACTFCAPFAAFC